MLVVIDPGHGGKDSGAVGPSGLQEKNVVLKVSLLLGDILEKNGVTVLYTRTSDTFVELSTRASMANKVNADFFISIHANSATSRDAQGIETYVYVKDGKTDKLASEVQSALVQANKLLDRGVKIGNLAVLRETTMPAILIELAFISNPTEEALLNQTTFLDQTANAIAQGFFNYAGIKPVTHWGQSAINELLKLGLITETKDPNAYVTWAEFATVLVRTIKKLQQ